MLLGHVYFIKFSIGILRSSMEATLRCRDDARVCATQVGPWGSGTRENTRIKGWDVGNSKAHRSQKLDKVESS